MKKDTLHYFLNTVTKHGKGLPINKYSENKNIINDLIVVPRGTAHYEAWLYNNIIYYQFCNFEVKKILKINIVRELVDTETNDSTFHKILSINSDGNL